MHTYPIIANDLYQELLEYARHLSTNVHIHFYSKGMAKPGDHDRQHPRGSNLFSTK